MTDSSYTHLALIVDRSGSMGSIEKDMNGGIKTLLDDQAKEPGKIRVDVTTFDTTVETPFKNATVEEIQHPIISPRGMTALLDGIGITITDLGRRLEALPEDERPDKVIAVIVTDGGENSSREYTADQIKKLIETQQDKWQWEFLFLGANQDSFATASGLGIRRGSTINYDADADGTQSVLRSASAYLSTTRSGLKAEFTDEDRHAAASQ